MIVIWKRYSECTASVQGNQNIFSQASAHPLLLTNWPAHRAKNTFLVYYFAAQGPIAHYLQQGWSTHAVLKKVNNREVY